MAILALEITGRSQTYSSLSGGTVGKQRLQHAAAELVGTATRTARGFKADAAQSARSGPVGESGLRAHLRHGSGKKRLSFPVSGIRSR